MDFIRRHIGPSQEQQTQMLEDLGLTSLDELVREVVPDSILLRGDNNLPEPCSEAEALAELKEIAQNHNKRAILCFVIQREDVSEFQISNLDAVYKNAIYDAISCGVEIKIVQVKWTREGKCYLINIDVPIHTF